MRSQIKVDFTLGNGDPINNHYGKDRMVNKKSLGDVVREEVQKSQDPLQSSPQTSSTKPSSGSTRRRSPTKADLEQQVKELKSALTAAQTQGGLLQEKIQELQAFIQDKEQLIDQLKQEQKSAQEMISQLSEMNTELSQELEKFKAEKGALVTTEPEKKIKSPIAVYRRPQHALNQPGETEDFAKNTWLL